MHSDVEPFSHGVVMGEDRVLLAKALAPLLATLHRTKDGRYEFGGLVSGAEGAALIRAVMRLEAERLLVDADALGPDELAQRRRPEQRWNEAVTDLVRRLLPRDFLQAPMKHHDA